MQLYFGIYLLASGLGCCPNPVEDPSPGRAGLGVPIQDCPSNPPGPPIADKMKASGLRPSGAAPFL
jgi:hypothetical protein